MALVLAWCVAVALGAPPATALGCVAAYLGSTGLLALLWSRSPEPAGVSLLRLWCALMLAAVAVAAS